MEFFDLLRLFKADKARKPEGFVGWAEKEVLPSLGIFREQRNPEELRMGIELLVRRS